MSSPFFDTKGSNKGYVRPPYSLSLPSMVMPLYRSIAVSTSCTSIDGCMYSGLAIPCPKSMPKNPICGLSYPYSKSADALFHGIDPMFME